MISNPRRALRRCKSADFVLALRRRKRPARRRFTISTPQLSASSALQQQQLHKQAGSSEQLERENEELREEITAAQDENERLLEQLESFMVQAEQLSHAHQRAAEQQANASQIAIQSSILQLQGLKEENAVLRQQLKVVAERQDEAVIMHQADPADVEPRDEGQQGEREEEKQFLFEQIQQLQTELHSARSSHEAYVDVVEQENQQLLEQVHVMQSDQRQGGFEDELMKKEKQELATMKRLLTRARNDGY